MRGFQNHPRRVRVVRNGSAAVRSVNSSHGGQSSLRSWARIQAERYTEMIKTLMVNDGGVECRQTPAEEGQQHTSQSAGIQGSAGQAATGPMGSGAAEGGSPGTADWSGVLGNSPAQAVDQRLEETTLGQADRPALGAQDQDLHCDGPHRQHRDAAPTPRRLEEHDRALEDQFERRRGPHRRRGGHWGPVAGASFPYTKWENTVRGLRGVAAPRYGHGQSTQVLRLLHVPSLSQTGANRWRRTTTTSGGSSLARSTRCASCTSNVSGAAWHRNTPSSSVWDSRLPSGQMHLGTWLSARLPGTSTFGPPRSTRRYSNTAPLRGRGTSSCQPGGASNHETMVHETVLRQSDPEESHRAEPCPHNRSHWCEWCREPHTTIHCTKPGRD